MAPKILQDPIEFKEFCNLLVRENVKSYLEIGSWTGGAIEAVANLLPIGSRVVSIDKPWKQTKEMQLRQTVHNLRLRKYDAHLFLGDSADPKIIAAVRALGPFDAVFIDGDHTVPYVKSDWQNYGTLGRVVGFHDIAHDMPKDIHGGPHKVHSFWNEFKKDFKHIEFISEATKARTNPVACYGIGVVWNV